MVQGLGSASSSPHIVDEEAVALVGNCKGKEKKKKGHKDTLPPSGQTRRRRTIPRWQVLQRWSS